MHVAFLPLSILGTVNFVTVDSCIVLNQVVVGSTMVRQAHEGNTYIIFTFNSVLTYEVYT